jgi:hypothetical protein
MRPKLISILSGALTGALFLGAAWATTGLLPAGTHKAPPAHAPAIAVSPKVLAAAEAAAPGEQLPGGLFKVGAAKVSIAPKSVAEGGPWIRDGKDGTCGGGQSQFYTPLSNPSCLRTFDSKWATGVDNAYHLGVYARALTISNGKDTIALAVIDAVGWFSGYPDSICADCGSKAIADSLHASLGIPVNNIVISSTHTHASADTLEASPAWYFKLVRDAIKQAITEAYTDTHLASLETGTIAAKAFNVDRRIVTRAVPDYELGWLRAVTPDGDTVATMVNYSVHPTITAGNDDLHSGLVGHLAKRIEERWGGTTLFMPAGLGDQTVNRSFGRDGMGYGLANLVFESEATNAYTLQSNEIVSNRRLLQIPADNLSLVGANKGGIFVRNSDIPGDYAGGPATSVQQKGDALTPSCVGASPISLYAPIGGFRIGTPGKIKQRDPVTGEWAIPPGDRGDAIVILQSPGEAFSSISATTKDYLSRARNVMIIGLANDQIGYIIPAEQYDLRSANAVGLLEPSIGAANYEESLSTGRCTGDQIQNAFIEIGAELGVLGDGEGR